VRLKSCTMTHPTAINAIARAGRDSTEHDDEHDFAVSRDESSRNHKISRVKRSCVRVVLKGVRY